METTRHRGRDVLIGVAITVGLVAVLELGARACWYTRAFALAGEFETVRAEIVERHLLAMRLLPCVLPSTARRERP